MNNGNVKVKLLVRDTFLSKVNALLFILPFFIAIIYTYIATGKLSVLTLIYIVIILVILYFDGELNQNVQKWNVWAKDDIKMYINSETYKIGTIDWELDVFNIREINIHLCSQPVLKGFTKIFFSNFINARMEIKTDSHCYIVPIQIKSTIKKLEKIFVKFNLKVSLDSIFYKM